MSEPLKNIQPQVGCPYVPCGGYSAKAKRVKSVEPFTADKLKNIHTELVTCPHVNCGTYSGTKSKRIYTAENLASVYKNIHTQGCPYVSCSNILNSCEVCFDVTFSGVNYNIQWEHAPAPPEFVYSDAEWRAGLINHETATLHVLSPNRYVQWTRFGGHRENIWFTDCSICEWFWRGTTCSGAWISDSTNAVYNSYDVRLLKNTETEEWKIRLTLYESITVPENSGIEFEASLGFASYITCPYCDGAGCYSCEFTGQQDETPCFWARASKLDLPFSHNYIPSTGLPRFENATAHITNIRHGTEPPTYYTLLPYTDCQGPIFCVPDTPYWMPECRYMYGPTEPNEYLTKVQLKFEDIKLFPMQVGVWGEVTDINLNHVSGAIDFTLSYAKGYSGDWISDTEVKRVSGTGWNDGEKVTVRWYACLEPGPITLMYGNGPDSRTFAETTPNDPAGLQLVGERTGVTVHVYTVASVKKMDLSGGVGDPYPITNPGGWPPGSNRLLIKSEDRPWTDTAVHGQSVFSGGGHSWTIPVAVGDAYEGGVLTYYPHLEGTFILGLAPEIISVLPPCTYALRIVEDAGGSSVPFITLPDLRGEQIQLRALETIRYTEDGWQRGWVVQIGWSTYSGILYGFAACDVGCPITDLPVARLGHNPSTISECIANYLGVPYTIPYGLQFLKYDNWRFGSGSVTISCINASVPPGGHVGLKGKSKLQLCAANKFAFNWSTLIGKSDISAKGGYANIASAALSEDFTFTVAGSNGHIAGSSLIGKSKLCAKGSTTI